jgi:hypothetical protein
VQGVTRPVSDGCWALRVFASALAVTGTVTGFKGTANVTNNEARTKPNTGTVTDYRATSVRTSLIAGKTIEAGSSADPCVANLTNVRTSVGAIARTVRYASESAVVIAGVDTGLKPMAGVGTDSGTPPGRARLGTGVIADAGVVAYRTSGVETSLNALA